jgi:hypothetical protein
MEFLNSNLFVKKNIYAIYKYVMNEVKEPNKMMRRLPEKHTSLFFGQRRFVNNNRMEIDKTNIRNTSKY